MANIQLYTGETENYYSSEQITELNKPLDQRMVSTRKNGGTVLKYIEGHTAIDQANKIFGYGNWSYKPLSVEQVVLIDPLTGEAVGIEYKAMVELTVRGAIAPIVDIGSQPVATWNVEDQIMGRRVNDAKYNRKPVDESPFTPLEKKNARAVIVDAHEAAKKGAVTDALKRALRAFGNQFGNELYGKDHPQTTVTEENVVNAQPAPVQPVRQIQQPVQEVSTQITAQQLSSIRKLCEAIGKTEPENVANMNYVDAKQKIQDLTAEYRRVKAQPVEQPSAPIVASTPSKSDVAPVQPKAVLDMISKAKARVEAIGMIWDDVKRDALGENVADNALTVQQTARINGTVTTYERTAKQAS